MTLKQVQGDVVQGDIVQDDVVQANVIKHKFLTYKEENGFSEQIIFSRQKIRVKSLMFNI
jgi:hypothetical protein